MIIVIVPVEYFFEAAVSTSVDLRGSLTLSATDETLRVGLVPSAGLVVRAGAYVTLFIVRAGLALQGTILQTSLVPMLSLNVGPSGKITACFDVSIELRPLEIQLQGRLGFFGCIKIVRALYLTRTLPSTVLSLPLGCGCCNCVFV
jgi:hypothetical protein